MARPLSGTTPQLLYADMLILTYGSGLMSPTEPCQCNICTVAVPSWKLYVSILDNYVRAFQVPRAWILLCDE